MRKISTVLQSLFLLNLPAMALAHGHEESLGHHWEEGAYIGEIHFQILLMVSALGLGVLYSTIIRKRKIRSSAK